MPIILVIPLMYCILFAGLNIAYGNKRVRQNKVVPILSVIFFVFSLSVIAFFTKVPVSDDLTRYYECIDNMRTNGMEWAWKNSEYKQLYVINLLFYVISRQNYNQILPFLVIFISYGLIFSIIWKFYKNESTIKRQNCVCYVFILFAWLPFRYNISGVRSILAVSLFTFALYREWYAQKGDFINYCFYIIILLIHPMMVIPLVFKFFVQFKMEKVFFPLKYFLVFWSFTIPIIVILLRYLKVSYLLVLARKLEFYSTYFSHDLRLLAVEFAVSIMILFALKLLLHYGGRSKKMPRKYYIFIDWFAMFTIGSIIMPTIFERCYMILIVVSMCMLIEFLSCKAIKNRHLVIITMIVTMIGMFSYQLVDALNHWFFYTF